MTVEAILKENGAGHPRVLIFVESDNGFGHFNIVDQVARKVQAQGGTAALASGTFFHPGGVFKFGEAKQYHLPTVVWDHGKKDFANPVSGMLYAEDEAYQKMRKDEVKRACEKFKPDVVVFELYPFLARYRDTDLEAVKEFYPDKATRPKIACLCRDIIHSSKPQETVQVINDNFDHMLVRGDGVMNKIEDCMPEFAAIKPKAEYLGNVVSAMPPRDVMPEGERPVFVFSGGGYKDMDRRFFNSAIHSRAKSAAFSKNPWKIVVSNNCTEEDFAKYQAEALNEAPDGSIQVIRPFDNEEFRKLLSNSAAAIVRGSYNTTFELVQAGVPFVVVPREMGINQEQTFRAEVLQSAGFARHVKQTELSGAKVAHALDEAAVARASSLLKLDFSGAERLAGRMCELGNEHVKRMQAHAAIPGDAATGVTGGPALEAARQRAAG